MKLLTVVVPAYNIEKYINRCLDSFISDKAGEWLEVIIVNDGSSDRTQEIADAYASRYPDIFKVISKENGGHGSGINCGVSNASGKYFKVVDADDWVDRNALLSLRAILMKTDAQLVTNGFCCVDAKSVESYVPAYSQEFVKGVIPQSHGKISAVRSPVIGKQVSEGEHVFDKVCGDLFVRMHSVTWRTDILKDNGIRIDENRFYVDMEYILYPIPYVKDIYFTDIPLYMYRRGTNGQSVSISSMQRNLKHHKEILEKVLGFIDSQRESRLSPEKLAYIEYIAGSMATNQCLIYLSFPKSAGMKSRFVDDEEYLYNNYRGVYDSMDNKAILALRASRYRLYNIASAVVRLTRR